MAIIVYFGLRIVGVLTEPNLPLQDGLFFLPLECNDVKFVYSPSTPKDGVLACSAGFTKNDWNILKPTEKRIQNSYTAEGVFHKKITEKRMGTFTFYNNHFYIKRGNPERELRKAAKNGGMGFQQWVLISDYSKRYIKHFSRPYHYRVLAEINSKLFFIEASIPMNYDLFVEKLMQHKVRNAIYLDTGEGWETYSLRMNGKQNVMRNTWYPFPFRTNHVVFY